MKKQFNRIRQRATRSVGRAEKTQVLSDDLLQVERRLELVKQVSHSSHKKLTTCLQGHQGVDVDRKSGRSPSRKLALASLAQCLEEGALVLGDDSLLGKMLKLCGETEEKLAQQLVLFEFTTEREVMDRLNELAEVEIPNIQKQRKHLSKLVLDMDAARTRYYTSTKATNLATNLATNVATNVATSGAKADHQREEMEEAATRMEICRDQLSADMYSFMSRENDYASYFQMLIEVQAEYHKKSLELLQNLLPHIKAQQESWVEKPCFGKPLEEHLCLSGRDIAFPIEACVSVLMDSGLREEGLFRVAPSASKLKKLKASLDVGVLDVQEFSGDPHAIAGALKSYLRELPEPLMTFDLYEDWIHASNIQDQDPRLQALDQILNRLPTANNNNLRYLIKFLSKLSDYQEENKMTPGNIAIVLGPNLLWTHNQGTVSEMMTTVSLQIVGIIEPIIQHADWFFPGDIEFNVTGVYGSPAHSNHSPSHSNHSPAHSNYSPAFSSTPFPDMDPLERRSLEQSRRPLSVATDNMMLEFYKKDGSDRASSSWGGPCYPSPSPEEERPPPPYPSSPCSSYSIPRFLSRASPIMFPLAAPPESVCPSSPPSLRCSDYRQQLDPPPKPPHLPDAPHVESNSCNLYIKPPLVRPRHDLSPKPSHSPLSDPSPLAACACGRDREAKLQSSKNKELSPGTTPPGGPPHHSPHTIRRAKKLAPTPPRGPYCPPGGVSDPSPVSLSPTPPSTPSYVLSHPQSYATVGFPPLPPPSLAGSLTRRRTIPKPPRHRPPVPPPQPPSTPGTSPPPLLDALSAEDSMSTVV